MFCFISDDRYFSVGIYGAGNLVQNTGHMVSNKFLRCAEDTVTNQRRAYFASTGK